MKPMRPEQIIKDELKTFYLTSPLNRMPELDNCFILGEPLVQFADGDDPIFMEFKNIIDPVHLTPREALARTFNRSPEDIPAPISVISWISPITSKGRESNYQSKHTSSQIWLDAQKRKKKTIFAMADHMVNFITEMGYLAVSPLRQPYFKPNNDNAKIHSNWSERHIAYAAGLGTFGRSDLFISEFGVAHACGSVVTDLVLPTSPRTATDVYANCIAHVTGKCRGCIDRCPNDAITENGHDHQKCRPHTASCNGLCQTRVPCEFQNPVKKLKKKK
jgi:hypothetical protein